MRTLTRSLMASVAVAALSACAGGDASLAPKHTAASQTPTHTGALQAVRGAEMVPEAPARRAETVKVGLMLPLTGPGQASLIAETMKKAAEMAIAETNARHVTLLVRDDKATPEGAVASAQDLAREKVEIILGPLFARSVQASAPIARQANVPLVAFSNDRQVAGGAVSLVSFLAEPEVHRIVAFAASKGKKRQIAFIPADSYGRLVEAAYRAAAASHGVDIVALEAYPPDQANGVAEAALKLSDKLRALEEHGDAVTGLFLPGGEEALALIGPHLKQAGFDPRKLQIFGTGAMDFPTAGRDLILQGAWFAAPDPKGWQSFATRFGNQHGHAPPRIASLAYDAAMLAISLSNGADGARYLPAQVTRTSGFEGIDGTFRVNADGTAERSLAVMEVTTTGSRVLDVAPKVAAPPALSRAATTGGVPPAAGGVPPAAGGVLSSIPSAFPVQ